MSTSFDNLREVLVEIIVDHGFDFGLAFDVKGAQGNTIILQNKGWALRLNKDGTWIFEDTSGG